MSLCGCVNLCESALSAIPFRFAHLNIRILILFRISCFVFRIFSSLYLLLSPAGALHLSSLLYKSASFLQNKPNFKMGNMTISTATLRAYAKEQRTMNNEHYSKQTQSKPISNAVEWCEKSHPTGLAGREIATHSTTLRAGFLAMTIGRAVPLGLRRRGSDELLRGPFSPRRR